MFDPISFFRSRAKQTAAGAPRPLSLLLLQFSNSAFIPSAPSQLIVLSTRFDHFSQAFLDELSPLLALILLHLFQFVREFRPLQSFSLPLARAHALSRAAATKNQKPLKEQPRLKNPK